jgi:hypothetical protein
MIMVWSASKTTAKRSHWMLMRIVLPLILFCCISDVMAQESPGPTAAQLIANQLGQLMIQNANLTEQISKLKTEIEELKKHQQGEPK